MYLGIHQWNFNFYTISDVSLPYSRILLSECAISHGLNIRMNPRSMIVKCVLSTVLLCNGL